MLIRSMCLLLLVSAAVLAAVPAAAGPYYARGTHYVGTTGTFDADAGNELFDDGLHGDGAAGDNVHAGTVFSNQPPGFHEFKIATTDWSDLYPHNPNFVLSNAVLYTSSPGEAIFFRLDLNARTGWQPESGAVACSHFTPGGTTFELIGSTPELGTWNGGVEAVLDQGVWRVVRTIATPGSGEFKFRVVGTWNVCNLGIHYNMFQGDNFVFATVASDAPVRFEFDTADGRGRALELDPTPTRSSSWGRLKALYR